MLNRFQVIEIKKGDTWLILIGCVIRVC